MPAALIDRLLNVATPSKAAMVAVPPSVPPPGFVPMAMVTLELSVVSTLPYASSTVTCTAGVMTAPPARLPGCAVKTSWLAAAPVIVSCCAPRSDRPRRRSAWVCRPPCRYR